MASGREKRESRLHLRREFLARPSKEGAESTIEPKLLTMVADEIEYGAHRSYRYFVADRAQVAGETESDCRWDAA